VPDEGNVLSFKFKQGWSALPPNILRHVEKNFSQYLEPPVGCDSMSKNETPWSYSKKVIDERRRAGKVRGGSVFAR
jgi:hypothetical protein